MALPASSFPLAVSPGPLCPPRPPHTTCPPPRFPVWPGSKLYFKNKIKQTKTTTLCLARSALGVPALARSGAGPPLSSSLPPPCPVRVRLSPLVPFSLQGALVAPPCLFLWPLPPLGPLPRFVRVQGPSLPFGVLPWPARVRHSPHMQAWPSAAAVWPVCRVSAPPWRSPEFPCPSRGRLAFISTFFVCPSCLPDSRRDTPPAVNSPVRGFGMACLCFRSDGCVPAVVGTSTWSAMRFVEVFFGLVL
jgi:hypothetical protein